MNKQIITFCCLLVLGSSTAQNPINASFKGTKEGPYTERYSDGSIRYQLNILNGDIQGDALYFYENGKLKVKQQFDKGEFHGTNYMLDESADTVYIEVYQHDTLLHSENFYYYMGGKLKSQFSVSYHKDETLRKNTFSKTSAAFDGMYLSLTPLEETVNNKEVRKDYFKTGRLKSIGEYEYSKNLYTGKYQEYYPNGTLREVQTYTNSKPDGQWIQYNQDGTVKRTRTYVNGVIQ